MNVIGKSSRLFNKLKKSTLFGTVFICDAKQFTKNDLSNFIKQRGLPDFIIVENSKDSKEWLSSFFKVPISSTTNETIIQKIDDKYYSRIPL